MKNLHYRTGALEDHASSKIHIKIAVVGAELLQSVCQSFQRELYDRKILFLTLRAMYWLAIEEITNSKITSLLGLN